MENGIPPDVITLGFIFVKAQMIIAIVADIEYILLLLQHI
jgi:hypothetical protein